MRRSASEAIRDLASGVDIQSALESASIVEVQVPYINEETAWEGRVTPWEFMLSSAARETGNRDPMAIVRWLRVRHSAPVLPSKPRVLYVECAPGLLAGTYEFHTERAVLESVFPGSVERCLSPSIYDLEKKVIEFKPHIIHIAGIDNNQARNLLEDKGQLPPDWPTSTEFDGVVFAKDEEQEALELAHQKPPNKEQHKPLGLEPIHAERLAATLNASSQQLCLVTANVYHSASRICALAVAQGAGRALGFQDTVSDSLAEVLLRDFYSQWNAGGDVLSAFVGALDVVRESVSLSGTGIVLWSADSLLDGSRVSLTSARSKRSEKRKHDLKLRSPNENWFSVDIVVRDRLNYSLLHNDSGGLFERLAFRKDREGELRDVVVEAVLYLGSESHPYSASFTLTEYLTAVDHEIKVPLTSSVIRTVQEPIRTSLFVKITVGKVVVYQQTHRVTLLPADEWKDSDADRDWLPSFVLPRDPVIESIIDRAQNHLITLADDHGRGFDGYQSVDPDDPASLEEIDIQVQAIWAAIANDFGIRYINPPPSYTELGQRLRTPTQVVRGGRGTCIDLALLLCACLEYIEVYPVIFLLEGHAFAGYWRSEGDYISFMEAKQVDPTKSDFEESAISTSVSKRDSKSAWILPSGSYMEVLDEVNSGSLYPVETVGFTTHGSFWEAVEEGVENLRSRSEFHSLIDIWLARSHFITPLPIIEDRTAITEGNDHV